MGGHDGWFGFGGGSMWVVWILIFIAVIWGIKASMSSSSPSLSETPLEILKKRYARGDIDEEEFNRRRQDLE